MQTFTCVLQNSQNEEYCKLNYNLRQNVLTHAAHFINWTQLLYQYPLITQKPFL